jgi:hypothetical protein
MLEQTPEVKTKGLVEILLKDGMSEAQKKLTYVKDTLRKDPK